MTKAEAQEILQEIKHYLTAGNPVWDVDEIAEALDIAIEALQNLSKPNNGLQGSDLIRRSDAIDAWWHDEVFFGNQRDDMTKEQWLDYITDVIGSLPSADAVSKGVFDQIKWERDVALQTLEEHDIGFGEATDRLYIKIYADDEPSVMAEKLYQICGETQNGEVAEWIKEYFPSADAIEVVRCKDCKRYESDGGALMICTLTDLIVLDDCYCWWGERREP